MSANDLLQEADKYVAEGRFTQAELAFAQAIHTPDRPAALNRYGDFLKHAGRVEQAASLFEAVLAIDPQHPDEFKADACRNLGDIAQMCGDLDHAEHLYTRALEFDLQLNQTQRQAADFRALGRVKLTRGLLDEAETMFTKALAIDKESKFERGEAKDLGVLDTFIGEEEIWVAPRKCYVKLFRSARRTDGCSCKRLRQSWIDLSEPGRSCKPSKCTRNLWRWQYQS